MNVLSAGQATPTLMGMHTRPERPSDQDRDTLPEFPGVIDVAGADVAEVAAKVKGRSAVRRTSQALAEFAKEAPEMVIGFIEGLLP